MAKQVKTNDEMKLNPITGKSAREVKYDFPEIDIGCAQYDEGPVGCTYVRFNIDTATFYADERGGWPGTVLANESRADGNSIRGICLAGGSLLGLEAVTGIMAEEFKRAKYKSWGRVAGAIIYSHNLARNKIYPDKALGRYAASSALVNGIIPLGQVGGGCSAGGGFYGQGASFGKYSGVKILVVTVVNALGSLYKQGVEVRNQEKLRAARKELKMKEKLEKEKTGEKDKTNEKDSNPPTGKHTTITTLVTDLDLSAADLKQLAIQSHTNMASVIRPFQTYDDGDTLFAVSTHQVKAKDIPTFDIREFMKRCSEIVNEAVLSCF